ncbi:YggT family protein [Parvularcula sp. ZS-1/3]|uniref:YggT family protein n=1 Tax=Parvularcula mediterranea TaxID=2732508 RepID=A0A7Y3RLU1_9PROT|nr:YggT family protein [Parvularcula mediterranea]NNU16468.1 YggT family protein [Parvularcula mediterranea]
MNALFDLILAILGLYRLVLIITIVMSWLFTFGVINQYNQVVSAIWQVCTKLTEPILRPIRNVLPSMGGLDLSPLIVFFGILFLESLIRKDIAPALT